MLKEQEQLLAYIEFCFPKSYEEIKNKNLISENLFSPFTLEIPQNIYDQVKLFVKNIYDLKNSETYQNQVPVPENFTNWPDTPSVLSCFDFHYSEDMGLKLIEINTNASLYLPLILQRCGQADHCIPPQFNYLLDSFTDAFNLSDGDEISIFDEVPENEGLYFEFLIFKEWLESKGYKANIISLADFEKDSFDKIYNRYTDFYFDESKSMSVKKAYFEKEKLFSPNPKEYFLMADKKRLNLMRKFLLETDPEMAKIIPETKLFSEFDSKEELWANRKKYFFKPSQSFGSKGAFSGKSISKKAFENIYDPQFVAQELCPAGKRDFTYQDETHTMKYDLRFFTYKGEVHNYGARLYQGQTTNMKTPFGGLAPIKFT